MPGRPRTSACWGRRERGSWVTSDLLRALSQFPQEAQLLLLYARSLGRKSKYYPSARRLARVMGESESWVNDAEDAAARCGLLTDQWLGARNLLDGGLRAFITIRALNGMRERGLSIADRLTAVRLLVYAGENGCIRGCRTQLAERIGLSMHSLLQAIRRLQQAQVLRAFAFASYVR